MTELIGTAVVILGLLLCIAAPSATRGIRPTPRWFALFAALLGCALIAGGAWIAGAWS